ncbi:MAG: phosphatase PAP2 family protein [Methylobacter sp.]|uniref:phosphatase PAP2 family protein n=1 Tax=Methylobacter sp. TaxID=2051955 RepID=UPI002731C1BD|nr:phosphatase PAP2 family protein [Methylobacter sp.]MDP1665355.1 phosphatase PAP2 family protein [Methylobacter sp.]
MRIFIYVTIGSLLVCVCLIAQGPLPGDVQVTRTLQSIFGNAPPWAQLLTNTAKIPVLWGTLVAAILLAFVHGGWRSAIIPAPALILAQMLDALLRGLLIAPRPTADLVAVATPSMSSGLPSTFGLVYGALFGVAVCLTPNRNIRAVTASAFALFLIFAGGSARIVLGGHWASQIVASTFIGLSLAAIIQLIIKMWNIGYRTARQP